MKTTTTLSLLILLVGLVSGCGDSAQPMQSTSTPVDNSNTHASTNGYVDPTPVVPVINPVTFRWIDNPPANSDQSGVTVLRGDSDIMRKNFYIVIDGSGSMDGSPSCGESDETKMAIAKSALLDFIALIPNDANVGMAAFDTGTPTERVALSHGNMARSQLIDEISSIQPGGGTPLHNAGRLGYLALLNQGIAQRTLGTYDLIIVTDGEANSGQDPTRLVDYIVANSPVTIHTVGFCLNEGHSLNRPDVLNYHNASDATSLLKAFNSVLAESASFSADDFSG